LPQKEIGEEDLGQEEDKAYGITVRDDLNESGRVSVILYVPRAFWCLRKKSLSSWQIDVKGLASAYTADHSVLVAYRELQKAAEYLMRETGERGLVPVIRSAAPQLCPDFMA
jgi:hypothetical protein